MSLKYYLFLSCYGDDNTAPEETSYGYGVYDILHAL